MVTDKLGYWRIKGNQKTDNAFTNKFNRLYLWIIWRHDPKRKYIFYKKNDIEDQYLHCIMGYQFCIPMVEITEIIMPIAPWG